EGERAQRILAAMRTSVGTRGAAGSTFDHVAREAGVSRGLLHYYFGSKEQLLVEVVRRDCDARIAVLEERFADADSAEAIVEVLLSQLQALLQDESQSVVYEVLSASRRSDYVRDELAEVYNRWREHLADVLREKERAGVIKPRADAAAVAAVVLALGDGFGLQLVSDPERDASEALEVGITTVRWLLGADQAG
nr:TetR/AcrR family transcriptional regulator [Thermoleophilaceae bacterium]